MSEVMSSFRTICVDNLPSSEIEQWFRRGVTLLVGSWISSCGPFEPPDAKPLPHGGSWNSTIWRRFFGSPTPDRLKQLLDDFGRLPFEALMQCYQNRGELRSLLQRLYGGWAHNRVHKLLVDALGSRRIQSLITTNYDLGLDHCIGPEHRVATIHDEATFNAYRRLPPAQYAPYYKIHGTALKNCEHGLVCDLGSEKRLAGWRFELLQECVRNRTLLIVGYSGRDFDICPDLSWRTSQAETVWLAYDLNELSPMARQLLERRGGMTVCGDGITFLSKIFGQKIEVESGTHRELPELALDPELCADWRLRLVNWMAVGELAQSYLDDFVGSEADKCELRASIYGHVGRYRDAVRTYAKGLQIRGISTEVKARLQIGKSGAWFIYGAYMRSWLTMLRARHTVTGVLRAGKHRSRGALIGRPAKLSLQMCRTYQDLLGRLHELQMVIHMRFMEIARNFGLDRFAEHCCQRARRPYGQAKAILERTGSHERLQALQHNAERLGIAKPDGLALPIDPGYSNLGLTSMDVIAQRDRLRKAEESVDSGIPLHGQRVFEKGGILRLAP